jgi:hypothetical protein
MVFALYSAYRHGMTQTKDDSYFETKTGGQMLRRFKSPNGARQGSPGQRPGENYTMRKALKGRDKRFDLSGLICVCAPPSDSGYRTGAAK